MWWVASGAAKMLKPAKTIGDVDFSASGGLGYPYPYEAEKKAKEIEKIIAAGGVIDEEEVIKLEKIARLKAIITANAKTDPLQYLWRTKGMEKALEYLPKSDVLVLFGGKRSSKTTIGTVIADKTLCAIPGARVTVWSQTIDMSKELVQKYVWDYLPHYYNDVAIKARNKIKGSNFSIDYKQKTGFSGDKLIIPPVWPMESKGSEMSFRSYSQFQSDPDVSESYESDLEWYDEEPQLDLLKRGRSRVVSKGGKVLVTATLTGGYGDVASFILDGATTVETRYCEYLKEELPVVQKSNTIDNCYCVYLWAEDNPFIDRDRLYKSFSGLPKDEVKMIGYGLPMRRTTCKFPKFSRKVHVVKHEDIPTKDCTNYLVVDPAGEKNWTMVWMKAHKSGKIYVYREWPDMESYGLWALPAGDGSIHKHRGSPGPAQKGLGYGYDSYAKLIKKLEENEVVAERIIDSRFANRKLTTDDGNTTTIERLADNGIYFYPTKGDNNIGPGLQLINDHLDYDTLLPIGPGNQPKLYFSDKCGNVINCMENFTGLGGYEEYYKDFIDCVRYGLQNEIVHFGSIKQPNKGGHW